VPDHSEGAAAAHIAHSLRLQQRLRLAGAGSLSRPGRPTARLQGN